MTVLPSLISSDLTNLREEIQSRGIELAHFDVMDGTFVPEISFGSFLAKKLETGFPNLRLDVHLMVQNPHNQFRYFAQLKNIHRIIFHFEGCNHHIRLINQIKDLGIQAGIAINPETSPESLNYLLEYIDCVCVMSVVPGYWGQKFIPASEKKIIYFDQLRDKNNLDFKILVDGGVNQELVSKLKAIGADEFVMGSAFFGN
ncbi:MAG: ribulose-phosphate 3-epimerase [Deltaproteobacteria bacterium]|nr:ribulose-phosphate 3-epimerase [Deltaproteobacteria bacterium]